MKSKKYRKLVITLNEEDKEKTKNLQRKGIESVRVVKRARILELLDVGLKSPKIATVVGVTSTTVRNIGWRYAESGLACALYDKPRPGKKRVLDKREESYVIAMVCSDPPEGYARWSVRLTTEEAYKRKIIRKKVSREKIRRMLKDHDFKPWREKNVVRS